MSVWKRIESKVFDKKVDKKLLEVALQDLQIGLDYDVKEVANAFGKDIVDAALINKATDKTTSMGIVFNKKGGIELVGDIWGTGFGKDGKQEDLLNRMAQQYQKQKMVKALKSSPWNVKTITTNKNNEIEIMIETY